MRRLWALLLAVAAALCVLTATPAAADGPIADGTEFVCEATGQGFIGNVLGHDDACDVVGDAAQTTVDAEWKAVWDSVVGDLIRSAMDTAKWILKVLLTLALQGPSLNLEATGLFGQNATLAGMLVWLGWVIATLGLIWQLGKMAVTGQMKYAGQAMIGFLQNAVITGFGVTVVAMLLKLGDAMTTGLVDATFADDGEAYKRIAAVMVPAAVANPVQMLGIVVILVCVGLIQLVMVFLRQSAIPLQCLLLPIAGAGRVGGDATRQWAPRLITSILVVIAYKPVLAIIICTGFSEFGHSSTLAEWLRGVATLILGVLAPGPLTKLFAPLGAEMGAGLSAGGAMGAVAGAGAYFGKAAGGDESRSGGSSGGAEPTTPVERAAYLAQTMPRQGADGEAGEDAVAQAARNGARVDVTVPAARSGETAAGVSGETQAAAGAGATGAGAGAGAGAAGASTGTGAAAGGAGAAAGPVVIGIQVLDGVNDTVKGASGAIGSGDKL